jgi:putative ABC transport system ATP-binding protein
MITGPSGAGKTTLLRSRNRLDIPDAGIIRYRGQPLDGLDPLALRRRAGMVFQRPVSFPGSVAADLAEALPGITAEEMAAALDRVALDPGLLGQEARTLSGGELQRMCLARTLVTRPETLLLDEPTSALDAQPKLAFEQTARDLATDGITIIWVTHDDAQAGRVADRICHLRDGRLAEAVPRPGRPAMSGPVSWAGLGVSLLLVAAAAGISWWQRLGLERQVIAAALPRSRTCCRWPSPRSPRRRPSPWACCSGWAPSRSTAGPWSPSPG